MKESVAFLPERSLRPACGQLIHSELIHLPSSGSPLIQCWRSERRDVCLYPAAAWAGAQPSPAEGRPPWPRTHTDALVVRGELIYSSPLSHIILELRVLLTCCAAEPDGQLSRDRQHPHILQGRKNHPVTQGHFRWWQRKGWMKSILDMSIKYALIVYLPLLERLTWSSPLFSLCSSRNNPESGKQIIHFSAKSLCTCYHLNNETAMTKKHCVWTDALLLINTSCGGDV